MANFLNEIIESTIQPVKTNVLWIKNGVPYYYNKRWKPLLGGASGGTVDSPITFGEGEYSAILNYSNNNALGSRSIALGYNTTSYNNYEASFGKYNKSVKSEDLTKATLFSVGNGNATFPKNALEIKWDGSVYISGIDKSVQDYLSSIKTYDSEINDILESIKGLSDHITITDSKLETKFEEFEEGINGELEEYYSKLTQTAKEIRAEVGSITTELDGRITENTALISITAKEIRSEVSEITTDLDGRIETNKSSISQTAEEIRAEVSRVQTDLSGRIDTANSTISQTADAIRLEVEAVEGELNGKIERNTSLINQTAESIGLEVTNLSDHLNDVNSELAGLIAENKAAIEINANEIKNKVSSDTFNVFSGEVQNQFTEVSTTVEGVKTSVQNIDGKLTEVNATVNGVTTRLGTAEADIESLKKQSDGSIDTHFGTEVPTLNNEPAVNWVTDDLKNEHTGDIYYNNNTGEAYRFSYNPETNEYFWIELTDSALTDALDKISKLESAVDGKVTIFYTTPTNYKYGDMWFVHEDNASFKKGTLVSATNLDKDTIRAILVLADWKEEIEYVNFDELTEELTSLNDYIDNAFKDGVLSEAEIKHIQELKKNFQLSYKEINDLNSFLIITAFATEENKTALSNAKKALDTAFNELIDAIDNLNTELDEDGNNPSLALYNAKYQAYLKALDDYTEIAVLIQSEAEQELLKPSDYIKQISSDGYLTPIEKKQLIAVWKQIAEEFTANRGIAFNYKILKKEGNNYIDRTDIYDVDTGYHTIYNNYKNSYEAIASIFTDEADPFGFKDLQNTTILSETTIESLASIEQLFDTYYANLALFSEMISKISNDITDAHQKVIDVTNALVDQLDPREAITQIGTGVVLSSVLGVKDINGNLEAVLNGSDNIEEAQSTKHGNHGKIVFAGGINGSSKWDDATTIIYEDGHVVINSGEISDFVSIGNATFKNVVEAVTQFDVISSPHVNPDTGEIEYIPLFQVNRNDAGEIIYVSSVYDFVGNREISALGFNAGGGSSGGGLISKVYNSERFGTITDNANNATFNAYAIDSLHKRIKNLEESEVDLTGYATEEWVMGRGFITASALAPYLKASDFETWKTSSFNPVVSQVNTNKNNIAEILKWFAIDGDGNLYTTYNFYSTKEISSGGFDSGSNGTGGLIGVVYGKSSFGTIANEANNATFNAYAIDSLYKRIVLLENKEVDLTGYATEAWVAGQGYITSTALTPYLKTADANSAFATLTALNTLKSRFDALDDALNDDVSGKINTWNEIVDFLDEYNGSEDLATILSGMNADIVSRLKSSDFDKWKTDVYSPLAARVSTAEGNISTNAKGIADNKTAINNNATAITNLGKRVTANEGNIAKILKWFSVDADGNLYTTYNLYSTKEISANGLSVGTGGGGGGLISQVFGTTAFGTIASESNSATFNAYAIDSLYKRIVSLEGKATAVSFVPALTSGKQIGTLSIDGVSTVLYGVDAYSKAEADSTFLKLSGGTISGNTYIPLKVVGTSVRTSIGFSKDASAFAYLTYNGGSSWAVTNEYYNNEYTLYHSGNFNPANYLPVSGGTIGDGNANSFPIQISSTSSYTGISFATSGGTGWFRYQGGSNWGVTDNGWNNSYTLLHSGNIRSHTAGSAYALHINEVSNVNDGHPQSFFMAGFQASNRPDASQNYATGITLHNNTLGYSYQLAFSTSNTLYSRRKGASGWESWRTVAFTDSNVASATKLATARTIWGQSFDGSGNVSGTLYLPNNEGIYAFASDNKNAFHVASLGSDDIMRYGYASKVSHIRGNSVHLLYGSSHTTGFILNSSGNVTIGSSDLAGTNAKLYVDGTLIVGNNNNSNIYMQRGYFNRFVAEKEGGFFGWRVNGSEEDVMILNTNGSLYLYKGLSVTGDTLFYNNVGIGTTNPHHKLEVTGDIASSSSLRMGLNSAYGAYLQTNEEGGWTGIYSANKGNWQASNMYLMPDGDVRFAHAARIIGKNTNGDTGLFVEGTQYSMWFGVGSGNVNRGIFDINNNGWWIYRGSDTLTRISGGIETSTGSFTGAVSMGSTLSVTEKVTANYVSVSYDGLRFSDNANYALFMDSSNKVNLSGYYGINLNGAVGVTGLLTANSGVKVASGQALTFLDASGKEHKLTYDSTAGAFKFDGNILVLGDGQFNAIN